MAKVKSEYASAKEIVEMKLMEVEMDCAKEGKEYTIEEVAKNIKEDDQITIEKYYNSDTASIASGVTENLLNLKGIVVSVDEYSEYKFLIGENCTIDGVTMQEIADTTDKDVFLSIEEFEKQLGMTTGGGSSGNDGDNVKEEIKDVPVVGEDVDITNPIEVQTYMLITRNSKNVLNLAGVENATYTIQEKTNNVNLSGNILTANSSADSSDSCKIQITGTYSEQSYINNLTVYVEPEKTILKDDDGNEQEAYAMAKKDDFLRIKEIIENVDNSCNVKLTDNVELNSSDQYEFDENGKITFKETAQKYNSIGSTDRPYEGILDGSGYSISGLYIEATTKTSGLFGMVSQDGEIKNLVIENSYIYGNRSGANTGYNEGKIYRCKVQNTTIENDGSWSGGIIGLNNGSVIECASISVYVNGDGTGGIAGGNGTNDSRDGFTHNSTTGYIYRCYSTGYIGYTEISGIASHSGVYGGTGYIYDCYSRAKLNDNYFKGSIVAVQSFSGKGGYIYNSYYLNTDCNFPSVATSQHYGTVENSYSNDTTVTAAKLNGTSGTAWINDTQNIKNGYPILAWQIE